MKKSRKSKIVLFSVLGLATVSLATVGFASWVISGETPASDQNITAAVGDVVDNTLSAEIQNAELSVRFDNKEKGGNFANGNTGEKEDLTFSFDVIVTGSNSILNGLSIEFTPETQFEALTGSGTSDTADNYITMPYVTNKTVSVNKDATTITTLNNGGKIIYTKTSDTSAKYACTFEFGWGDAFLNVNPTNTPIKSSDSASGLTKSTLISRLNNFKTAFASVGSSYMTVTVTPVAVAA